MYLVLSQLTQCAGIRWYTVNQRRNAFDLLVNSDSGLCGVCFVHALFLHTQTADVKPKSVFSAECRHASVGSVNQPYKSCITVSEDTRQWRCTLSNNKYVLLSSLAFCFHVDEQQSWAVSVFVWSYWRSCLGSRVFHRVTVQLQVWLKFWIQPINPIPENND